MSPMGNGRLRIVVALSLLCPLCAAGQSWPLASDVNAVPPTMDGVIPLPSQAVLKEGCFSCYSTVPDGMASTLASLTTDNGEYLQVPGTMQYVEVDTLVVVYRSYGRDYAGGQIRENLSAADIETLKAEVAKSRQFLWRSSHLKCLMKTDWMVMDRMLTPAQLWDLSGKGGYWLTYWSIDGKSSVERDLLNAGVAKGRYSVVIVLYAFENSDGVEAAIGGGTYGVDIGFLGNTAYIAIPLAWGLNCEEVVTHEYLHALDSIYTASGNPGGNDMGHADHPELFAHPADSARQFYFLLCSVLDPQSWLQLNREWVRVATAQDSDGDGIPDSGDLPITEETFGSSPAKADTDEDGLNDANELIAAFWGESNPRNPDTDGDGLSDGVDPYPLFWCNDQIPKGEPQIDGVIGNGEYGQVARMYATPNPDINAAVYAAWSDNVLYIAADITDNVVQAPYQDPFWQFDDNFEIDIDARQNGWFCGDYRSYRFYVVPVGPQGNPHVVGEFGSLVSGQTQWRAVDLSGVTAKYALRPGGYVIEMAIRSSAMNALAERLPDVRPSLGSTVRLTFSIRDYDAYGDWPEFNVFTGLDKEAAAFVTLHFTYGLTLVSQDAPKRVLVPQGPIDDAWQGGQDFNDADWISGVGSVGYQLETGTESFFDVNVEDQMYGKNATCYIRIPFSVASADLARLSALALGVRYDDGFVAYINGVEVCRVSFVGDPAWDSAANVPHPKRQPTDIQMVDITSHIGTLRAGANILAIHGLNASSVSSDFLISAELLASKRWAHGR